MLSGIGQLTQLTALWLRLYWDETDPPRAPSHAFSALTASSKLQFLHAEFNSMTDLDGNYAVMPGRNVLQHMFPFGRQLPQLERLALGCAETWYCNWRVPAADLERIASSCPRLRSFGWYLLDPAIAADLSPLLRLTRCSSLRLGGEGVGSTAAPIVAQLTQLTSLEWGFCVGDDLDSRALAQLTKLKKLQQLELTRLHWHGIYDFRDWSRADEDEELVRAEERLGRQFHGRLNPGQGVSPVRGEPHVASAYTGSAGCWGTLSGQLLISSD